MHSLMPLPTELEPGEGELLISMDFGISLTGFIDPRLERAAERLTDRVNTISGMNLNHGLVMNKEEAKLTVHVDTNVEDVQSAIEDESYSLEINTTEAVLKSKTIYGALRGMETFIQLIRSAENGFTAPAVSILDSPRFPWRGLLIDSSRHWIPPSVIKRNLEAMASVKLNVLHWHLTNDQGFRIESKRYPKLHELGSDGQFYTQHEVKEIIEFAKDRGIRVLPEFDMPGHTSSWFVGYPELASSPGSYRIERKWGGHDATMNPSSEDTFIFISHFLSEMASLFPDPYVHVGGDEVNGKHWQGNPEIQKFMVSNNIDDIRQLHAYFNSRVHSILQNLDKKMVGWDPILHADLPDGAVIQSVRGQQWLAKTVVNGFQGIAGSEYYLDLLHTAEFYYSKDPFGAETANLTSEQQQLILGGEASMWTEFATAENIDSRIWPSAAVVAERLWSVLEQKDVEDMYQRLEITSQRLAITGVTHKSGPRHMMYRLANYGSIRALSTLVETLRPTFDIRWNNQNYSTSTSLIRLVDATVTENETVRVFSRMVEEFIANPSAKILHDSLVTQLKTWQRNNLGMTQIIMQSPLLTEVLPLSKLLTQVCEAGLKSIELLSTEQEMAYDERKKQEILLNQARKSIAELELIIVPDIQKLTRATIREVRG